MRQLWTALIIWSLILVLKTCDSRSMGQRWSRVRKVAVSSSQGVHHAEVASSLGSGSNIAFRPKATSRQPCKKTVIFNEPGSLRKLNRNRNQFDGKRLRKVKVVKKYSRQQPALQEPFAQKQFIHLRHSRPEDILRVQSGASQNQRFFFKSTEHSRPESRQIVILSGAHSATPDYGRGWGRAMNDVTIVHNRRKYTLNTRSKAKLKGFPGLVMHVKKMNR